ncbi:MAG: hypothetical protein R3C68_03190 [Myxococcota bacterium]
MARAEFVQRTGDMFEGDESYERRLASFLEWYVLDRGVSFAPQMTPVKLYIESVSEGLTTPEINALRDLTRTVLSLFEFKRVRGDRLRVVDLLTNNKVDVFERRRPSGLESGDILEARLVPKEDTFLLSETIGFLPRDARKDVLKASKRFRKKGAEDGQTNIDLVHRVAYLSNRCERYSHVPPESIFAELH